MNILLKVTMVFFFMLSCHNNIVHHPARGVFIDPGAFGWSYEDIYITTKNNIQLHAWRLFDPDKKKIKKRSIILHFHGNSGNVSTQFISLGWLLVQGYEVYVFDYPGYGFSQGEINTELIHKSSVFILNHFHILAKSQNKKLIVFAQSLGSAIAMRAIPEMKDRQSLALLVVEGAFDSYESVAYYKTKTFCFFPFSLMLSKLISDDLSPRDYINKISPIPLIVIHGSNDQIIPVEFGKRVFTLAKKPKKIWIINKGGHINWLSPRSQVYKKKLLKEFSNIKK